MVRYDMFDRDTRVEQESYESDVTTSHGHAKQVLVVFVMDVRPMPQQDLYRFWATQRVEQKRPITALIGLYELVNLDSLRAVRAPRLESAEVRGREARLGRWRPATARLTFSYYKILKKPSHYYAKRYPWRDTFSERV